MLHKKEFWDNLYLPEEAQGSLWIYLLSGFWGCTLTRFTQPARAAKVRMETTPPFLFLTAKCMRLPHFAEIYARLHNSCRKTNTATLLPALFCPFTLTYSNEFEPHKLTNLITLSILKVILWYHQVRSWLSMSLLRDLPFHLTWGCLASGLECWRLSMLLEKKRPQVCVTLWCFLEAMIIPDLPSIVCMSMHQCTFSFRAGRLKLESTLMWQVLL